MSMVRNGRSCVWSSGMAGSIAGKNRLSHGDPKELADAVREVLEQGSINLYMFHGGTNFGFMNGCSARGTLDLPQVTSYDYDALLDEEGNPTAKYLAVKKMMATHFPEYPQLEPLYEREYGVGCYSTG